MNVIESPKILVCITNLQTCKNLIKIGANIKKSTDGYLTIIHVTSKNIEDYGAKIEYLYRLSKECEADMSIIKADNTLIELAKYIRNNNINIVVMGEAEKNSKSSHSYLLKQLFGNSIDIRVIAEERELLEGT